MTNTNELYPFNAGTEKQPRILKAKIQENGFLFFKETKKIDSPENYGDEPLYISGYLFDLRDQKKALEDHNLWINNPENDDLVKEEFTFNEWIQDFVTRWAPMVQVISQSELTAKDQKEMEKELEQPIFNHSLKAEINWVAA